MRSFTRRCALRRTLQGVAAVGAAMLLSSVALAADMKAPKGDVEITVGSGAGATPDVIMRRVAKILNDEKLVEQPIVIQNRTGGGWTVAGNYVMAHPGAENLLFAVVPTVFATPILQGLPNTYEKVTPLAMLARFDLLVVVAADSPITTLSDFVAKAKKEDKSVSMAGANVGSTDHIVATLIEKAGGVKLNYVPFDGGGGQITSALLGGTVDAITLPPDEAMPLITGKKVKAIAVLSEQRRPEAELKDIPTAKEQGLDVLWSSRYGIAGPPNMDPALAAWWDDKFGKMVKTPAWSQMIKDGYLISDYVPMSDAKAEMDKIHTLYVQVMTDLGLAKKQ